MKIIYDNIDSALVIDTDNKSFEDTIIYVPNTYNFDMLNLYINDILIETRKTVSNKAGYKMFVIDVNKTIPIVKDNCSVILQGVNLHNKTITSFNEVSALFDFETYNEMVLKNYSTKISESVSEKYEKIYKLVELSAKIYESIKKIGDDNE